ncbi:hypothetical protein KGEDBEEJ_02020 [Aeromonas hydrophila]|nr:hypothetical protein KBAHV27_20260 [Aeromonas hydrophila]CAD7532461.1 hypothetical protein KBAHV22_20400 [Aeromonas hydrophila]CAD7532858.1 hypothetical protein KBAHV42_21940 [Aeromonas hydrophila]CAD7539142.1 hypothetical protein KBAHV46_26040 [Aeromonas hydrophila]CAD7540629.1 hypothetical protein KBAHV01_25990 [Aeromonas hydrophila]
MGKNTSNKNHITQALPFKTNATDKGARRLTAYELAELRQDMVESSAKMRTELARRRHHYPTKQDL